MIYRGLLLMSLSLFSWSVSNAESPKVTTDLMLGAGVLDSSLYDTYYARERFPGNSVVGLSNLSPVAFYRPEFSSSLSWNSWVLRLGLAAEIVESPPNDTSRNQFVLDPWAGQFYAQKGITSNAGAYRAEAGAGYRFKGSGWSLGTFLIFNSRQEDFDYEAFPLANGVGVLGFRNYDQRWQCIEISTLFRTNLGTAAKWEVEPYFSIWGEGKQESQGTSFQGTTALFEQYHLGLRVATIGMHLRLLAPIEWDLTSNTGRLKQYLLIGLHRRQSQMDYFIRSATYFGDPVSAPWAIIRDWNSLNSTRIETESMIYLGIRIETGSP